MLTEAGIGAFRIKIRSPHPPPSGGTFSQWEKGCTTEIVSPQPSVLRLPHCEDVIGEMRVADALEFDHL